MAASALPLLIGTIVFIAVCLLSMGISHYLGKIGKNNYVKYVNLWR